MPELAELEAARTRLPVVTDAGDTVTVHDGVIYLNARRRTPTAALELSIALARAVHETTITEVPR